MKQTMGYYPGCSLQSTAYEYDQSIRAVYTALDINLAEIPDWNCCGASSAHSTNMQLADSLILRNLMLAETAGFKELIVPCAACYNLFKTVNIKVQQGDKAVSLPSRIVEQAGVGVYRGTVEVEHPLQSLSREKMLEQICRTVVKPLRDLKVVTYYGCLLTRPKAVAFDDIEYPITMDHILTSCGAEVQKWSYKVDCCGASLALSRPVVVGKFTERFKVLAKQAGAEAIVTACPLCLSNLDTCQNTETLQMPIFYFSELIGLSFGHTQVEKWLAKHIVNPAPLLTGLNLL